MGFTAVGRGVVYGKCAVDSVLDIGRGLWLLAGGLIGDGCFVLCTGDAHRGVALDGRRLRHERCWLHGAEHERGIVDGNSGARADA